MAAGTANGVARRAWGRPPSVRHVRIFGPAAGVCAAASSGARHGPAGEPPSQLPRGDPELPGVRLGAHDVGGRGGHGERWASRLPRERSGAEGPQPRGALSVRRRQRQRLSEGPASPLSPSRALSAISWAVDLVFPLAAASALAGALSAMACLRAARRARGGHSCSWAACSSAFAVGLACFPSCGSLPLSPQPCKAQPAPLAFPGATRGSGRGGVTLLSCL